MLLGRRSPPRFVKKVASLISALSSHASFFARMVEVIKRLRPGSPSMYRAYLATTRDVIAHFLLQEPRVPLVKARVALGRARPGHREPQYFRCFMDAIESSFARRFRASTCAHFRLRERRTLSSSLAERAPHL